MPLTVKKNGISSPKPTAESFDSSTVTSWPRTAIRVIIPATKPPRTTSRPSSAARAARPNTSNAASRTASWLLASIERSSAPQPTGAVRTETRAMTIASAMNSSSGNARLIASWVERTSVSSRIGPNSPIAPAASRNVPKRVRSSSSSRRIGIRVPIAVVASAEPVYRNESTIPAAASAPPIP